MVIALAGEKTAEFTAQVSERLGRLRPGRVVLQPDLLAMFGSGTHRLDGYGLIAGTGSIAASDPGWCAPPGGRRPRLAARRCRQRLSGSGTRWPGRWCPRWTAGTADRADAAGAGGARDRGARLRGRRGAAAWCPRCMRGARCSCRSSPRSPSRLPRIRSPGRFSAGRPRRWPTLGHRARAPVTGPVVVGGSVVIRGFLAGPPICAIRLGLPDDAVPVEDGVVGAAVLALRGRRESRSTRNAVRHGSARAERSV